MNQERIFNVLIAPHVSEKSALNAEYNNQYVFKVAIDARKPEIKKAVELRRITTAGHLRLGERGPKAPGQSL